MGLFHCSCDFFLLLEILALTKMSLMYLSFLKVMIIDMLSCIDFGIHSQGICGMRLSVNGIHGQGYLWLY